MYATEKYELLFTEHAYIILGWFCLPCRKIEVQRIILITTFLIVSFSDLTETSGAIFNQSVFIQSETYEEMGESGTRLVSNLGDP